MDEMCKTCGRRVGISDGDDGGPPVDLSRCARTDGWECLAVAQAVRAVEQELFVLRDLNRHATRERERMACEVERLSANGRMVAALDNANSAETRGEEPK